MPKAPSFGGGRRDVYTFLRQSLVSRNCAATVCWEGANRNALRPSESRLFVFHKLDSGALLVSTDSQLYLLPTLIAEQSVNLAVFKFTRSLFTTGNLLQLQRVLLQIPSSVVSLPLACFAVQDMSLPLSAP